jgi:hypothetical protein
MTPQIILTYLLTLTIGCAFGQEQLIIQAANNCADTVSIDRNLFWYAAISSETGDYLRTIDPISPQFDQLSERPTPFDIELKNNERTIFVIGSSKKLDAGLFQSTPVFMDGMPFLRLGKSATLYVKSENISVNNRELMAYGCVEKNSRDFVKDYNLVLRDKKVSQDIIGDFEYLGEMGMPALEWCGDIDGDLKPDMLFSSSSNSRNVYTLFLTTNTDELVRKAGSYELGNCY